MTAGRLDTLIQVDVLIEGWNSPRCKLLIDLAPSVSRVRATQKYFRVMTRLADAEARIYVFLPKALPRLPVLPMDLFGQFGEYECGEVELTWNAIGDRLSVSKERARQIAVKAMRKLRGWMIRTDKVLLRPRGCGK